MIVIRSGDGRPLFRDGGHLYVSPMLLDMAEAGDCDDVVSIEGDLLTVTTAGGVRRYLVGPLVGGYVHELEPMP